MIISRCEKTRICSAYLKEYLLLILILEASKTFHDG
jgi:hypothetical protein